MAASQANAAPDLDDACSPVQSAAALSPVRVLLARPQVAGSAVVNGVTERSIALDFEPDDEREFLVCFASIAGHSERLTLGSIRLGPAHAESVFAKFVVTMQAIVETFMADRYGEGQAVWLRDRPDE